MVMHLKWKKLNNIYGTIGNTETKVSLNDLTYIKINKNESLRDY